MSYVVKKTNGHLKITPFIGKRVLHMSQNLFVLVRAFTPHASATANQTCLLPFAGFRDFMKKYPHLCYEISSTFGPPPDWESEKVKDQVVEYLESRMPVGDLPRLYSQRAANIAALCQLRRNCNPRE